MTQSIETILQQPNAIERAYLLRQAVGNALDDNPTELGRLQKLGSFTVLVDDPTGHFPTQTIEPAQIRYGIDRGNVLVPRWFIRSRILRPNLEQSLQGEQLRRQKRVTPRTLYLHVGNLSVFQPVEEADTQTWDTMN